MQVYALNDSGERVFVDEAEKSSPYFCLECGGILYKRGGDLTVPHFYHSQRTTRCSQEAKSLRHIQLQRLVRTQTAHSCFEEFSFPTIRRIADLYIPEDKVVIEIQCSMISKKEVEARVHDYRSLGLEIIWILDEKRFYKRKISAAEHFLFQVPHYFARGLDLYDYIDAVTGGLRKQRLFASCIDIRTLKRKSSLPCPQHAPIMIEQRLHQWPLHVQNDFLDTSLHTLPLLCVAPPVRRYNPFSLIIDGARTLWYFFLTAS